MARTRDIYTGQGLDLQTEDDEISAGEEGFMRGYIEEYVEDE